MHGSEAILVLVVVIAVCFDFTNGFHDTANAVAKGIVNPSIIAGNAGLEIVLAVLIGAIVWNLITWLLTLPSSSSHALIGGVIGATLAAAGHRAVSFHEVMQTVIAPAVLSPIICCLVAIVGTYGAYRLLKRIGADETKRGYRYGQIGSAALVSLAHGTNDAQKTMGVITLALIAHGDISANHFYVPVWVKIICALAIASGTAIGGWRIINTMGNRITEIEPPQGFAAEASSAAVILSSSYYGYPLSTTHVVSGGVLGAGLGKRLASVHWGVAGQMATAWIFTIPAAGAIGALAWEVSGLFGRSSNAGSYVIAAVTAVAGAFFFWQAQHYRHVGAHDLDRTSAPPPTTAPIQATAAAS
jgi:inorganic phosphate transporter, PiT family